MGKYLISVLLAALLVSSVGCNNSSCMENRSSIPLAKFYGSADGKAISVDSVQIGGVGAPNDSLLLQGGRASQVYLPLRAVKEVTSFYFHYTQKALDNDAFNDTITFGYKSIPYFASVDCGALYRYRISHMSYTRHLIDSVAIIDSLITNLDRETVKIYFRTKSSEEEEEETQEV